MDACLPKKLLYLQLIRSVLILAAAVTPLVYYIIDPYRVHPT